MPKSPPRRNHVQQHYPTNLIPRTIGIYANFPFPAGVWEILDFLIHSFAFSSSSSSPRLLHQRRKIQETKKRHGREVRRSAHATTVGSGKLELLAKVSNHDNVHVRVTHTANESSIFSMEFELQAQSALL